MGPFEYVLDFLYTTMPTDGVIAPGQGLIVGLAFRIMTIVIAFLGIFYYLSSRQELSEVLHEEEMLEHAGEEKP